MIIEEEIKEILERFHPRLTRCPYTISPSSPDGTPENCRQDCIECITHELYTKLFTAPPDLSRAIERECFKAYHRAVDGRIPANWTVELREAIHSLYVQAGWKSPEEVENLVTKDALLNAVRLYGYKTPEQVEQAKKEEREKIARVLNEGLESTRKPSQWQGTVVDYEQWGKDCVYPIMLKLEQGQALKEE